MDLEAPESLADASGYYGPITFRDFMGIAVEIARGTNVTETHVPTCFFIPFTKDTPDDLPSTLEEYPDWMARVRDSGASEGAWIWTLQTYLQLRKRGHEYTLFREMPSAGIILSHRDFLHGSIVPNPEQLVVCLKADRATHPFAQLHIVQNERDLQNPRMTQLLFDSIYIPHWPQPGLLPRSNTRGDCFETVGYFGNKGELAKDFCTDEFRETMSTRGFDWVTVESHHWHDYREIDVVLAVRDFNQPHDSKPASKLVNAWLAGVPAIVGPESAFHCVGREKEDCFNVRSLPEVFQALELLRRDKDLRAHLVQNGLRRSQSFTAHVIAEQWQRAIHNEIPALYFDWKALSTARRRLFFARRRQWQRDNVDC